MRSQLLSPGGAPVVDAARGAVDELHEDLELDTLLDAMAAGDPLVRDACRAVLRAGCTDPEEIRYRQQVLADCLARPADVRRLYALADAAVTGEQRLFQAFFSERPETLLVRAIQVLELFLESLRDLRRLTAELSGNFSSEGLRTLVATVDAELDDDYFAEIAAHLKELRFPAGLLISAGVGVSGEAARLVIRRPDPGRRTLFSRVALAKPWYGTTVDQTDQREAQALTALRDAALHQVAVAASGSADHVLAFFRDLRTELAFYIGAVNLHATLTAIGAPTCVPEVDPVGARSLDARGLYDVCLCLRLQRPVVANDVAAGGADLVMVTGANRGGKSTFLRSVGLAQLMAGAGMFVPAERLRTPARTGVFSHFTREEDVSMSSGKLDEELVRLSAVADRIRPGALLLCNESFQSTNEREASEIARQVVRAMTDSGVAVVFVTHLYDLASSLYRDAAADGAAVFLRAEHADDGRRTFRVLPGAPMPTGFATELYDRVFAGGSAGDPAGDPGGDGPAGGDGPVRGPVG